MTKTLTTIVEYCVLAILIVYMASKVASGVDLALQGVLEAVTGVLR